MRTTQLEYFAAVARHSSFSRAAEDCHVAQPAISQQVRALEKELGFPLFNRTTHGVTLTQAGRSFYRETAGILDALDRSTRKARAISQGSVGSLSIGVTNSGQTGILGIVRRFSDEFPEVDITLRRSHTLHQGEQLLAGVFDVTMTAALCVASRPEIAVAGCAESPLCIVASRTHPLAMRKGISIDELCEYAHIVADHENDDLLYATYPYLRERVGVRVIRVEDQGIGLANMLLGFGIEAMPHEVAPAIDEGYAVCDVPDYRATLETGWAYVAANKNPALAKFLEFVAAGE